VWTVRICSVNFLKVNVILLSVDRRAGDLLGVLMGVERVTHLHISSNLKSKDKITGWSGSQLSADSGSELETDEHIVNKRLI